MTNGPGLSKGTTAAIIPTSFYSRYEQTCTGLKRILKLRPWKPSTCGFQASSFRLDRLGFMRMRVPAKTLMLSPSTVRALFCHTRLVLVGFLVTFQTSYLLLWWTRINFDLIRILDKPFLGFSVVTRFPGAGAIGTPYYYEVFFATLVWFCSWYSNGALYHMLWTYCRQRIDVRIIEHNTSSSCFTACTC